MLDNRGSLDLSLTNWFSHLGISDNYEHFILAGAWAYLELVTDFELVIPVLGEMITSASAGKWPTNAGHC